MLRLLSALAAAATAAPPHGPPLRQLQDPESLHCVVNIRPERQGVRPSGLRVEPWERHLREDPAPAVPRGRPPVPVQGPGDVQVTVPAAAAAR